MFWRIGCKNVFGRQKYSKTLGFERKNFSLLFFQKKREKYSNQIKSENLITQYPTHFWISILSIL